MIERQILADYGRRKTTAVGRGGGVRLHCEVIGLTPSREPLQIMGRFLDCQARLLGCDVHPAAAGALENLLAFVVDAAELPAVTVQQVATNKFNQVQIISSEPSNAEGSPSLQIAMQGRFDTPISPSRYNEKWH